MSILYAIILFGMLPFAGFLWTLCDKDDARRASAIEARRAETQGGSVADESAVGSEASETPTPSSAQPGDA